MNDIVTALLEASHEVIDARVLLNFVLVPGLFGTVEYGFCSDDS
jgi:hypothetical protein